MFDSARSTAVDHTAIAKEAIKGRSMERRAAIRLKVKLLKLACRHLQQLKILRMILIALRRLMILSVQLRRMAGVVAGLGAISQAALMNKNLKDDRAERDALRAARSYL